MAAGVNVKGTDALVRALGGISKDLRRNTTGRIKATAEPARVDAEGLARQHIRNIGPRWSRMRLGYARGGVYLAPTTRSGRGAGRGTPRPNLAPLLLTQMERAADNNVAKVTDGLERLLDELGASHGF